MNKIDRHNYEEYFILYMDNELSSDDRRMVETFVQAHPDLKEELELLQQFKLSPDNSVRFTNKEELYKHCQQSTITADNYENWLLLYIDNELSPADKTAVTDFVATNPAAQKELNLLQQSRLQVETIVFPGKKSLYRKEEKVRRIIPVWMRVAAAIVIVGGVGVALLLNQKSDKTEGTIVKATDPANHGTTNTQEKQTPSITKTNEIITQENGVAENAVKDLPNQAQAASINKQVPLLVNNQKATGNAGINNTAQKNEVAVTHAKNKSALQPAQEIIASTQKQENNNLTKPVNNPYVNNNTIKDDAIAVNTVDKSLTNPNNNSLTKTDVTKKDDASSGIVTASFVEDENTSKKNKGRGLFRKIARTFEKRTNIDPTDDNGRLLVAGFAFKTK